MQRRSRCYQVVEDLFVAVRNGQRRFERQRKGGPGGAEAKLGSIASYSFVLNLEDGCVRWKFCHEAVVRKRFSHRTLLPLLGVNVGLFLFAHDIRMDGTREDPQKLQAECSEAPAEVDVHFWLSRTTYASLLGVQLHDIASGLDCHDRPFVRSDIKNVSIGSF